MRALAGALGLLLFSTVANGQAFQSEKPMFCDKAEKIIKALIESDYHESPIWIGKDDTNDSRYALFSNEKTKSWTFLQYNDKFACILGVGSDSKLIDSGLKTKLNL